MHISTTGSALRRARLAVVLTAGAILMAACGGTSSGGTTTTAGGSAAGGAASGGSTGAAVVTTHSSPIGTYLTDAQGRTLYLFVADTGDTSTCTGGCATAWPPLTTTGTPTGSGQVNAAWLGTTVRDDGTTQVTYAGHPLYYFARDTSAGAMMGQGSNGAGAKWWVVAPSGNSITKAAPAGGSGSGSSGGGSTPAPSSTKAGGWA